MNPLASRIRKRVMRLASRVFLGPTPGAWDEPATAELDWDVVSPTSPHLLTAAVFRAAEPSQETEAGTYVAALYRHNRLRDEQQNLMITRLLDTAAEARERAESADRRLTEVRAGIAACEARARAAELALRDQRIAMAALQAQFTTMLGNDVAGASTWKAAARPSPPREDAWQAPRAHPRRPPREGSVPALHERLRAFTRA